MEIKTAEQLLNKLGILGLKRIVSTMPDDAIYYSYSTNHFYTESSIDGVDDRITVLDMNILIDNEDALIQHHNING